MRFTNYFGCRTLSAKMLMTWPRASRKRPRLGTTRLRAKSRRPHPRKSKLLLGLQMGTGLGWGSEGQTTAVLLLFGNAIERLQVRLTPRTLLGRVPVLNRIRIARLTDVLRTSGPICRGAGVGDQCNQGWKEGRMEGRKEGRKGCKGLVQWQTSVRTVPILCM
eukprot:1156487-Pelagomonas_calceolata.AAC.6